MRADFKCVDVPLQGSSSKQAGSRGAASRQAGGQSMAQRGVNGHGCCILPVASGRELIVFFAKQAEHGINYFRVE